MGNNCSPGCPGDVFDGVLFCVVLFSHKVISGTELSQFLRIFLSTLTLASRKENIKHLSVDLKSILRSVCTRS